MSYPHRPTDDGAPLLHWRDGAVARLRFNRPRSLNAIDGAMADAFHGACRMIAADPLVRVVVLDGEGRAFMAGGDVAAMQADPLATAATLIAGMHGGLRVLAGMAAPSIAVLHGAVAGGGLGVALGCDLAIAAEGTRLDLAYTRLGTSADCSTSWNLPRIVGLRKALEIALLCEPIDAAEALRLGLVNRVVPADRLRAEADSLAQRLADGPTLALGRLKRLMRESSQRDLDGQLDAEADQFRASTQTADFAEGVDAFLSKRRAVFAGR
jgi:2-(1,2-epoxy-1,2-dihydrophenyl)acetyl-CoA isomerase